MVLFGKLYRKNIYYMIISFFGVGAISNKMPGTIGSFVAMLIAIVLPRSALLLFVLAAILFVIGTFFCERYIIKYKYETHRDPKYAVIDEVCGIFLGCSIIYYFALSSVISIVMNFLLFRVFDIVKPFPIKNIEKLLTYDDNTVGLGIMTDDVLAAIFAASVQVIWSLLWEK